MEPAVLTKEQQEIRLTGIGASEIAAVVGLDPYRRPIDVYAQKLRLVPPFEGNRFTRWGSRIEGVIADAYAEENGVELRSPGTLRHLVNEWMLATPDRLVYCDDSLSALPTRVLEIKTAGVRQAQHWGQGEDEVPEQYLAQCAWEMAVTNLEECDLAVLIGGNEDRLYRLHRDRELEGRLIEIGWKFWHEHVLTQTPPDVDGSDSWARFLVARYPRDERPMLEATEKARALRDALREARHAREVAEEAEQAAENGLKAIIGDAAGIQGIATWRKAKDSKKTDWEAVAREAGAKADLIAKHTLPKPGSRRFLPNLKEE